MIPKNINLKRLSPELQQQIGQLYEHESDNTEYLATNQIYCGDSQTLLEQVKPNSVALSIWSPPYCVGKKYEADLTFEQWQNLLSTVIHKHFSIIKPGGFLVINIADILVFKDPSMPQIQADVVSRKKSSVTREDVLEAIEMYPDHNRHQLAKCLGCSEQTVDRRLNGNNIRGGKSETQTRVKVVGGLVEEWALDAGFYTYDRRIWLKDAAWQNSRWASLSYRSVDEFEYLYFFWKPGVTKVDRKRLMSKEWSEWGSRGVWQIPSVRANDDHEAKFPIELPLRAIRMLTDPDEVVLDCFMGSGTTAVAAIRTKRQYIGIELSPEYAELARHNAAKEPVRLC